MTIKELVQKLKDLPVDPEESHYEADELLLEFINNEEVNKAYSDIIKWYA